MMTGGAVTSARQVDGHRKLWEITVTPNGNADVNVYPCYRPSCATPTAQSAPQMNGRCREAWLSPFLERR